MTCSNSGSATIAAPAVGRPSPHRSISAAVQKTKPTRIFDARESQTRCLVTTSHGQPARRCSPIRSIATSLARGPCCRTADAWCTRDIAYQQFRAWQEPGSPARFLVNQSMSESRWRMGAGRMLSDTTKSNKPWTSWTWRRRRSSPRLKQRRRLRLIHGHTHRPAGACAGSGCVTAERWVLPRLGS